MGTIISVVITSFMVALYLGCIGLALYLPAYIKKINRSAPCPVSTGAIIHTLRGISLVVLVVGWPVLTFFIPFMFTTDKAIQSPQLQSLLATYLLYPPSYVISAFIFRQKLVAGDRRAANLVAGLPLVFLLLMSTITWLIWTYQSPT